MEPERDIGKALKACARRREEEMGPPREMHPATRRLLQGEVARLRAAKPGKQNFWSALLGGSWPQAVLRFSMAAGLLAVAGWWLFSGVLSKQKSPVLLVQSTLGREEKPRLEQPVERQRAGKDTTGAMAQRDVQTLGEESQNTPKAPAASKPEAASKMDLALDARREAKKEATDAEPQSRTASALSGSLRKDRLASDVAPQATLLEAGQAVADNFAASANLPAQNTNASLNTNETAFAYQPKEALGVPLSAGALRSVDSNTPADAAKFGFAGTPALQPPTGLPQGGLQASRQSDAYKLVAGNMGAGFTAQDFVRVSPGIDRRGTATVQNNQGVLDSFRMEQSGDQIRVIDHDGSVYLGVARIENETAKQTPAREEEQLSDKAATDKKQTPPAQVYFGGINGMAMAVQNYSFRVSGTNRSLNQQVVLTGNYAATAPMTPSLQLAATNTLARRMSQMAATGSGAVPAINSHIQGRVVIGGTNQIEIEAAPVKP